MLLPVGRVADDLALELRNRTKAGLDEHRLRTAKYDKSYNVYRAVSPTQAEPWQSKLRVPYGMQVIDTAMVNMVSGRPRVIVRPRNPGDVASAKAMQALLDYYIEEDHLVEKQPVFVQQGLIFGVTVAKNHWIYQECVRKLKVPNRDLLGPDGRPALVPQTVRYVERDGPTFEPWSVYDAWWDPDARDVDTAEYVVLRSYVSPDQLRSMAVNDDAGTGVYRNVEQLIRLAGEQTADSTSQDRRNSSQKNREKIELQEIWRQTPQGLRVSVIGADSIIIRDEQTPYWHGKKPIVIAQVRPDLFEMAGIAETELVDHLQQALWTVQNMRMDNLHLTVMRGITYREGGVTDPNALELRPRFKWPVSDHDDVQPFDVQPLPPEAYSEQEGLLGQLQLVTGINPYVSGAGTEGVDQNTATGVTALQEVASRLLRFKASVIANKGYQRTYEQWTEMIMQLQDRDVVVEIVGPDGASAWQSYSPHDIVGSYKTVLEGSEESLSRQQERGEAVALLNAFAPLIPTGQVSVKPLLERVAAAYNFPSPEALFPAAPPAPPVGPTQQQPQAQQPPQLLGGQNLDPRILQAIQGGQ